MKLLWGYLLDYIKKFGQIRLYFFILLFLFSCITVNYYFKVENTFINPFFGKWQYHVALVIFYLFPFIVVSLIVGAYQQDFSWLRKGRFWLLVFIGINLLAFDGSFIASRFLPITLDWPTKMYLSRIVDWSRSLLIVVFPIWILYRLLGQTDAPQNFGLTTGMPLSAYLQVLIPVLLIIFIGSFSDDLQQYYPRFIRSGYDEFADQYHLPRWCTIMIYQLAYGIDFIGVELIFRGFFIWGFVRYFGANAVLPMVAVYAFLHFGKPASEAISSIFGGFFLGVVSYQSRNIWGGVLLHLGVAWSMELFGYLHRIW